MSSSSDSEIDYTPDSIKDEAKAVMENLLPPISKERYMKSYNYFMKWRAEKNVTCLSEDVFLTYFSELSEKLQPSTLWSIFSMLNTIINTKHDINLKNYTKLTSFLKKQSHGFKCKKSKVFTGQEVETFLNLAPDEIYLAVKVALIIGISGACRNIELTNITVENVEKHDQLLLIKLPNSKAKMDRIFVVREEFARFVQRYQELRPDNLQTNRFFLNYQKGKCLRQVIGKNKFSSMPKQIAKYLNLPNPHLYSGHCFRRTSATLLANSGADLTMLKKHGGWKSAKVAEDIEEPVENKPKITEIILHSTQYSPQPGSSKDSDQYRKLIKEEAEEVSISARDNQPTFSSIKERMPSPTFTDVQDTQISEMISNVNSSKDSDQYRKLIKEEAEEVSIPARDNQPTFSSSKERMPSPTFIDVQDTQISETVSNVNITGKNLSISFTNCSNCSINFK